MRLILCPKLVRDNVPDRIEENGGFCIIKHLTPAEHRQELLHKLVEESHEVLNAKTPNERQAEIADVLEVLSTIQTAFSYSPADLDVIRKRKAALMGGFRRGLKLMFAIGGR